MRNNSKKALYESIMKDVAKVVKRQLNEAGSTSYINDNITNSDYDDLRDRMRRLYNKGVFDRDAYKQILTEIDNVFQGESFIIR